MHTSLFLLSSSPCEACRPKDGSRAASMAKAWPPSHTKFTGEIDHRDHIEHFLSPG